MNYWDANLNAQYNPRSMSDNATRGGPLMQNGLAVAHGRQYFEQHVQPDHGSAESRARTRGVRFLEH